MERRELTVLENEIHDLATAFRGILEWKWDERFKTVLAEFSVDKQGEILAILEESLVHKWDSSRVSEAPPVVQDIVGALGGLMPGQLLFHSGPEKPLFLFCAWWPWGNGRTISIRIAPFGKTLSDEEASALTKAFRDRFDA